MCEDPTNKNSTLQHAMQAMEAINDALGSASPSVSGLSVGQSHGSYAMHIGVQEESRRTGWGTEA